MKEEIKGVWRTVRGRRVFIKEGQDLKSAMIDSGKFKELRKVNLDKNEELLNEQMKNSSKINQIDREIDKKDFSGGSLDEDYEDLIKERRVLTSRNADLQKERELKERKYYENSKYNREGLNITKEQYENIKQNSDVNNLAEKTRKENFEASKRYRGNTPEQIKEVVDKWKERKTSAKTVKAEKMAESQINTWEKEYNEAVNNHETRYKEMNDRDIVYKNTQNDYESKVYGSNVEKADDRMKEVFGKNFKYAEDKDIQYETTKKDLLKHYTEDYGWSGTTPEEAFIKQMDAVNYGNATPYQMGKRLAEGGNYEVYNGNMQAYLKSKGIDVEYDEAFNTYTDYIGKQSARLYDEIKNKQKASSLSKDAKTAYKTGVDKNDFAKESSKYGITPDKSVGAYEKAQEKEIKAKVDRFKEKKGTDVKTAQKDIPESVVKRLNQKGLKELANNGATDITRYSEAQLKKLEGKHGRLEVVKTTKGTYGMNGGLFRSHKTGEYFVITSRNGNLFYLA